MNQQKRVMLLNIRVTLCLPVILPNDTLAISSPTHVCVEVSPRPEPALPDSSTLVWPLQFQSASGVVLTFLGQGLSKYTCSELGQELSSESSTRPHVVTPQKSVITINGRTSLLLSSNVRTYTKSHAQWQAVVGDFLPYLCLITKLTSLTTKPHTIATHTVISFLSWAQYSVLNKIYINCTV
jgi:hypothetical protein